MLLVVSSRMQVRPSVWAWRAVYRKDIGASFSSWDSQDGELAEVLAKGQAMTPSGYRGAWSAQVNRERLTIKFHLIRQDEEWERLWTYPEPGGAVLDAIAADSHRVAIVPATGDLSEFVREGRGGALVVDAYASGAVTSARAVLAAPTAE